MEQSPEAQKRPYNRKPKIIESTDEKAAKSAGKVLCETVQLYAGLDLIGSKQSVHCKTALLEVTPMGVKMTSKKTNRVILLPWSNIKGCELMPE